jgi:hypothetical protein
VRNAGQAIGSRAGVPGPHRRPPVFADIEPDQFCLDAGAVEAAVTGRTKGIMPVHLYAHPLAHSIRLLRNQGMQPRYENEIVGFNADDRRTRRYRPGATGEAARVDPAAPAEREIPRREPLQRRCTPVADGLSTSTTSTRSGFNDRDGFARALVDEHGIGSGVPTVRRWWCPSPRSCGIIRLVCALGLPGLRGSEVFQQGVQLSL